MGELHILRIIHVVGGMFWVGSFIFNTIYLFPALAKAGPASGAIMGEMMRRKLMLVMPTVGVLTILSGIRLMWITSGDFASEYFASGRGLTFAVAGGAAIVAFLLGMIFMRPLGARVGQLRAAMASAPEAERPRMAAEADRLQRLSNRMQQLIMVLLLVAAVGMSIGRYM